MVQITKADIVMQEVDVDLSKGELDKAKCSAALTDKGWVLVDAHGTPHWMHIIADLPATSSDWVYDTTKGMIKVTMKDGVPIHKGDVKITEENINVINDLPGYENSVLKVGETISFETDLSNKPVVIRTTKREGYQNYPASIQESFISKFIMKKFNIKHVMVCNKVKSFDIFWEDYF